MDAYSNYILQLSNAKVTELRREAAEYALSASTRRSRPSWWSRIRGRLRPGLRQRRFPAPEPELAVTPWGSQRRPSALDTA